MGIVDEDIARVREATDVAAVIGEQVALRRVGNNLVGLCPFHAEKSPSFSVNAAQGLWYCFGCQARGDVITFVRETQHLDFAAAVEWLAVRTGIQLRYDTPGATREHQRKSTLTDALDQAVQWYHERLLTAPDAAAARRYLRHERGYDGDTVRAFRLGWAPAGWDELCRSLNVPADVLRDAGIGFTNKAGKQQDVFRGRVMFPIFEVDGKAVGMGGRILPGGDGPKYKNSQEGPLYSKRRILYGLNWAKDDIVTKGEVIVCEGYTDVIAFHRAGLPRAVATCGTALADEHMQRLKNFARRIILAYDADSAGQGAAEKFYAWEQKLELDIHVLRLPTGTDPGEFGTKDPDGLREAVAAARPFLAFRVERIFEAADMSTNEGRTRAGERALEAVAAHPSDLTRDQYVMQVADRCRLSADRLRDRLGEIRRNPRPRDEPKHREAPPITDDGRELQPPAAAPPLVGAEPEALRLAIHRPEAVAHLLEEVLFVDPVHLAGFRALLGSPTLAEAIDGADPDVQSLLYRLGVEEPETDPDDVVALLVRAAAERAVAAISAEIRQVVGVEDVRWASEQIGWAKERMEALSDPDRRVEAAGQLVAWMSRSGEEEP